MAIQQWPGKVPWLTLIRHQNDVNCVAKPSLISRHNNAAAGTNGQEEGAPKLQHHQSVPSAALLPATASQHHRSASAGSNQASDGGSANVPLPKANGTV